MRVEKFIKNTMSQINAGCRSAKVHLPEKVEFLIRLDAKGFVCAPQQAQSSEVRVTIYNDWKKEKP